MPKLVVTAPDHALHDLASTAPAGRVGRTLPELSNFYCRPGKAGGTPLLPVHTNAGDGAPITPHDADLQGLTVLVVDDNAANRRILSETLSRWGMRPLVADSAPTALRLLEDSTVRVPLILTDLHMPEMDGFELAAQIKRRHEVAVVVMISSGSQHNDVARARELGVETYLTKPVAQKELQSALVRALARTSQQSHQGSAPVRAQTLPTRAGESLKILLAEDNVVNQKVTVRLLEKEGHRVVVVENGREAVAAVERESFHLVLMDVQMPDMDGFEATARIRAREHITGLRTPILALTAHAMSNDRDRCLSAGMDGYIAKPIRIPELLAAVGSIRTF